jgi:hypothetical protein
MSPTSTALAEIIRAIRSETHDIGFDCGGHFYSREGLRAIGPLIVKLHKDTPYGKWAGQLRALAATIIENHVWDELILDHLRHFQNPHWKSSADFEYDPTSPKTWQEQRDEAGAIYRAEWYAIPVTPDPQEATKYVIFVLKTADREAERDAERAARCAAYPFMFGQPVSPRVQ